MYDCFTKHHPIMGQKKQNWNSYEDEKTPNELL